MENFGCWVLVGCKYIALSAVAFSLAWGQEHSAPAGQALPDSPGSVRSQSQDSAKPAFGVQYASSGSTQQNQTREPVGTAAAEAPVTSGVAASEPAGAAIAPAKQRRVRMLVIKVGAIVGAGAAIGAVAALSSGSPSRPPGAH